MRPRMITRTPGTRTSRVDTRQRRIESLAAEFALLAQRRARVVHQIDLLDQQREAAAAGFAKLQARMAWLAQRMDALDPELRQSFEEAPPPPPPVAPLPTRSPKPLPGFAQAGKLNSAGARNWNPARAALHARPSGGKWRI